MADVESTGGPLPSAVEETEFPSMGQATSARSQPQQRLERSASGKYGSDEASYVFHSGAINPIIGWAGNVIENTISRQLASHACTFIGRGVRFH